MYLTWFLPLKDMEPERIYTCRKCTPYKQTITYIYSESQKLAFISTFSIFSDWQFVKISTLNSNSTKRVPFFMYYNFRKFWLTAFYFSTWRMNVTEDIKHKSNRSGRSRRTQNFLTSWLSDVVSVLKSISEFRLQIQYTSLSTKREDAGV